jgi:putative ABC transport system substrate-binding protein
MRRREFISLIGGAVAWPLAARAQTRALPVIGILSVQASDAPFLQIEPFLRGLGKMGYADGDTVSIEYRWAGGDYSKLPQLATELVTATCRSSLLRAMPALQKRLSPRPPLFQ